MMHVVDLSGPVRRGLALLGIALASLPLALAQTAPATEAAAPAAGATTLAALLEQMGQTQAKLKTLQADFVQEKTLELLAEPDVASGVLLYEAPHRILWEYAKPDPTVLLIDEKTLTAYYPDLKKADRVDISDKRKSYDKYFGVALGAEGPMQEYFEINLAKESGIPGAHLLLLTPKSKRVEKYLTEIRLWVDEKTSLPCRFEYREENGDTTSYTLTNVVANQAIPMSRFKLELPAEVEVTDVTGGFKPRRSRGL